MLTTAQQATAYPVAAILLFCLAAASAWFPPRLVGTFDAPADPVETIAAMGRGASALTAAVCLAVVAFAAFVFGWLCRPGKVLP